jgi:uncharacterized protein (TIGR02246 family)
LLISCFIAKPPLQQLQIKTIDLQARIGKNQRMNKLLITLLLLLAHGYVIADDQQALRTLLDDFLAGASIDNAEMHQRFWADDLIYTSSSGQRFGKQTIMDGLSEASAKTVADPVYSAANTTIRLLDENHAVITFQLVASHTDTTVDYYLNTGVFEKRDDQWRATVWQATKVPASED